MSAPHKYPCQVRDEMRRFTLADGRACEIIDVSEDGEDWQVVINGFFSFSRIDMIKYGRAESRTLHDEIHRHAQAIAAEERESERRARADGSYDRQR